MSFIRNLSPAAMVLFLVSWVPVQADVVDLGWDLLTTQSGTQLNGVPFMGSPLGSFDFGGSTGVQPTGATDTIVYRLSQASVPAPPGLDIVPIELVALHLVSVNPTDFGLGVGTYHITLQSDRGGPASTGEMDITINGPTGGTFDSFFDVYFDIRLGSELGPIAVSDSLRLVSDDVPWSPTAPSGALIIPGVNDQTNPFWPTGAFQEIKPGVATHVVSSTIVPLPPAAWGGAWLLALTGLTGLASRLRVRLA